MPEPLPRVSVVLPVHNGGRFLEAALDSILTQTFRELEFVIVDDGSTDATPDLLRRYEAADPRVRVHRREKAGLIASLNYGCSRARAAYIARMDADDIAFPDRLARQVEFLDRHPSVAMVGSAVMRIDADGREIKRNVCPTSHAEIVEALRAYSCFTHPSVMMRTAALVAVGGYRAAYAAAEDYDLWLRLSEGHELANLAEPLLYYRVYPEQVSIRHLDQQILSVVGARTAAQRRAKGAGDSIPAGGLITARLLHQWGVEDTTLADAMAEGYRYAAYVMEQAGRHDEAIALLRTGVRRSGGRGGLPSMLAGACLRQARVAYRSGRLRVSLGWGIRAWSAQPLLPFLLIAQPRRRAVEVGPTIDGTGAGR
jgi:hypothetical protein